MRHRVKGRILGRNASHRHAMFRNMAASLIKTVRTDGDSEGAPKVAGRIITTVPKAKELRPFVEKLITLAKGSLKHSRSAQELFTTAEKNSAEWKKWRESEGWSKWAAAQAPVVNARRRAFALLRDKLAVEILFDDLAPRFETRDGGYTRILRLPKPRLGDAGERALIEFVGERDRVKGRRSAPAVVKDEAPAATAEA
ncbi:bL17 family ribosomal protein [Planctomicrobium sp. SH664]|uniref:bL17 family ribosomal protein n=1 Tax=Planctomicrobium sp. SH664 TaxID=3448125 RepID=UPI003F5AF7B3